MRCLLELKRTDTSSILDYAYKKAHDRHNVSKLTTMLGPLNTSRLMHIFGVSG